MVGLYRKGQLEGVQWGKPSLVTWLEKFRLTRRQAVVTCREWGMLGEPHGQVQGKTETERELKVWEASIGCEIKEKGTCWETARGSLSLWKPLLQWYWEKNCQQATYDKIREGFWAASIVVLWIFIRVSMHPRIREHLGQKLNFQSFRLWTKEKSKDTWTNGRERMKTTEYGITE